MLGKYMGFRSDQRLRRFFEENRAPCVPALPRWCWGLGAGVGAGTGGPAGLVPLNAAAATGAVGPFSLVGAGSGGHGPGVPPPPGLGSLVAVVVVLCPPVGPQLVWSFRFR